MASPEAVSESPHPRRWLVLIAMTGSLAMIFLDVTVVAVALPAMAAELSMDDATQQWVLNAYTLTIASVVALGGRLADSLGRARVFVAGIILFALASAVCGLATTASLLLIGRVGQGLAASLMQPASSSIVIGSFAPEERGKAMGVYISIPLLFLTLGPLIGGLLTTYVSWHAVFFLNLPIAAAAIAITAVVRPPNGPRRTSAIRPASLALYLLGLPPLVFGIQQSVAWGWSTPAVLVPILLGLVACVLFITFERRNATPLLALRLFDDRSFLGAALVLFFQQFAVTGQVFFVSRYLQNELGFSASQAGAGLLPMLIPTILVAQLAGRMYDRTGARRPLLIGSLLAFAGLATEAIVSPWHSYPPLAIGLGLFGLGVGFLGSPAHTDALSRAGAERRGQASGLLGTMRQVGSSLGIAVLGALVAAHGASAGHWAGAAAFLVTFLCAFLLIGPPAHRAGPSAGAGSPPQRGRA